MPAVCLCGPDAVPRHVGHMLVTRPRITSQAPAAEMPQRDNLIQLGSAQPPHTHTHTHINTHTLSVPLFSLTLTHNLSWFISMMKLVLGLRKWQQEQKLPKKTKTFL